MGLLTFLRDVEMEENDFNAVSLQEFWNKTGHFSADPQEVIADAWDAQVFSSLQLFPDVGHLFCWLESNFYY